MGAASVFTIQIGKTIGGKGDMTNKRKFHRSLLPSPARSSGRKNLIFTKNRCHLNDKGRKSATGAKRVRERQEQAEAP